MHVHLTYKLLDRTIGLLCSCIGQCMDFNLLSDWHGPWQAVAETATAKVYCILWHVTVIHGKPKLSP